MIILLTCIGGCLDFHVGLDAAADGQEGVAIPPALAKVVDVDAEVFRHLGIFFEILFHIGPRLPSLSNCCEGIIVEN